MVNIQESVRAYKTEWIIFLCILFPVFIFHFLCLVLLFPFAPFILFVDCICACFGLGLPVLASLMFGYGMAFSDERDSTGLVIKVILVIGCGTISAMCLGIIFSPIIGPVVCSVIIFAPTMNFISEKSGHSTPVRYNKYKNYGPLEDV